MLLVTNLFFVNTIHHDIIVLILLLSQKLSNHTVLIMLSHISLSNVILISTLRWYSPLSRFAFSLPNFCHPWSFPHPHPTPGPFLILFYYLTFVFQNFNYNALIGKKGQQEHYRIRYIEQWHHVLQTKVIKILKLQQQKVFVFCCLDCSNGFFLFCSMVLSGLGSNMALLPKLM